MTDNEILGWLRLQRIPGVGPANGLKLIRHFGEVQIVFSQSLSDLQQVQGIGPIMAGRLLNPKFLREAENQYLKIQNEDVRCLPLLDTAYPELLRQCVDAPLVLFQRGPMVFSGRNLLSVVGTRSMTDYGRGFCEKLVEGLAPYNPIIVSGLAYGIDIYAQRAALFCGLQTVSCLGHGLDIIYPGRHIKYIPEILEQGALLSEFWLGTLPEPMNFVRRNRIIAGLSPATLVIESGSKGGSLITADLAFGYDREVFAVPGRTTDPFSSGCNLLIRQQKAQLLHSPEQLAEALDWTLESQNATVSSKKIHRRTRADLNEEETLIIEFLSVQGIQFLDEIAFACGLSVRETAALLFQMEMKEIIRPHPGKRFEVLL
jgi:DNA processing protein